MTKEQDDRFIAALERGMPKVDAIKAIYEQYPMTVSLGVLTATRPIGARVEFTDERTGTQYAGTLVDLTPSEHSKVYYVIHLRTLDGKLAKRLALSHPITMLTGPEGRPEDGHTFRITVDSRMASAIQETVDTEPHDWQDSADFGGPEFHVEVRAFDLKTALQRAAEYQLQDWRLPNGVRLGAARNEDFPA